MPRSSLRVDCFSEWMAVRFAAPQRCVSWAVVNGGIVETDTIAWRFLEKDELRGVECPASYLRDGMTAAGLGNAVGLMTSRRRRAWRQASGASDGFACRAVATVGLSNALAAGDPPFAPAAASTINLLCAVSHPLSNEAVFEALALAAEARSAAVIASGARSAASGAPATGTGTDCIVIAHPLEGGPVRYCGKHTAMGHAIGAAVSGVIALGIEEWIEEFR
jgi:adenosylcobinamide amidohydrolase